MTKLIIITGYPCTGKTTLANKISKELQIPLISKDTIKESLFNNLGYKDRAYSQKIGAASFRILYTILENLLKSKTSTIVESNFISKYDSSTFQNLINKYQPKTIQIICETSPEILIDRFKTRSESGERHPGHNDHLIYEEFNNNIQKIYTPLNIDSQKLLINTNNFQNINYEEIIKSITKT